MVSEPPRLHGRAGQEREYEARAALPSLLFHAVYRLPLDPQSYIVQQDLLLTVTKKQLTKLYHEWLRNPQQAPLSASATTTATATRGAAAIAAATHHPQANGLMNGAGGMGGGGGRQWRRGERRHERRHERRWREAVVEDLAVAAWAAAAWAAAAWAAAPWAAAPWAAAPWAAAVEWAVVALGGGDYPPGHWRRRPMETGMGGACFRAWGCRMARRLNGHGGGSTRRERALQCRHPAAYRPEKSARRPG